MLKEWMQANNIELNEVFIFEGSSYKYKVVINSSNNYVLMVWDKDIEKFILSPLYVNVFETLVVKKLPWKPKKGDTYYFPRWNATGMSGVVVRWTWDDDEVDQFYYDLGLICKTEDEAKQKIEEIHAMIKERYGVC